VLLWSLKFHHWNDWRPLNQHQYRSGVKCSGRSLWALFPQKLGWYKKLNSVRQHRAHSWPASFSDVRQCSWAVDVWPVGKRYVIVMQHAFLRSGSRTYNVCSACGHAGKPGYSRAHSWGDTTLSYCTVDICQRLVSSAGNYRSNHVSRRYCTFLGRYCQSVQYKNVETSKSSVSYVTTDNVITQCQLPPMTEVIHCHIMSVFGHVVCMESSTSSLCPGLCNRPPLGWMKLTRYPSHCGTWIQHIGDAIWPSNESWDFSVPIREWVNLMWLGPNGWMNQMTDFFLNESPYRFKLQMGLICCWVIKYNDSISNWQMSLQAEEPQEKKVLVLGLDGAGKSSILLGLTGSSTPFATQPHEGFNIVYLTTAKVPMSFWESKLTHTSINAVLLFCRCFIVQW